jgi:hypothetical protein
MGGWRDGNFVKLVWGGNGDWVATPKSHHPNHSENTVEIDYSHAQIPPPVSPDPSPSVPIPPSSRKS